LGDGQLYFFLGTVQGFPTGSFRPLTMYRANGANNMALRTDPLHVGRGALGVRRQRRGDHGSWR